MFFRYSHFSKTGVLRGREHHFWGFRCSQSFLKFMICNVFSNEWFWMGPELTFSDFGRFWAPPKSTLIPQKWASRCSESTISKKSVFFIKNQGSKKTWLFIIFGPPKAPTIIKTASKSDPSGALFFLPKSEPHPGVPKRLPGGSFWSPWSSIWTLQAPISDPNFE